MPAKRTCLIVGAMTGIGKEIAEYLAQRDWIVMVTGRSQDKGNKVGLDLVQTCKPSNSELYRS